MFGKVDPSDAPAGHVGLGNWKYRTEISPPPATGQIRFNNVDPELATFLWISETTADGTDVSGFLGLLGPGDLIYIQDQSDADTFITIEILTNVDQGNYREIAINQSLAQGQPISQNTAVALIVSGAGATSNNATYLRLDATNSPLTGPLGIDVGGLLSGNFPFSMLSGNLSPIDDAFVLDTTVNHTTGNLLNLLNVGVQRVGIDGRGQITVTTPSYNPGGQGMILEAFASHSAFFNTKIGIHLTVSDVLGTFAGWRGLVIDGMNAQGGQGEAGVEVVDNGNPANQYPAFKATNSIIGLRHFTDDVRGSTILADWSNDSYDQDMIDLTYSGIGTSYRFFNFLSIDGEKFSGDAFGNFWMSGAFLNAYVVAGAFQNLLKYSEQLDNPVWVKGANITVTANNEINPGGLQQNADTMNRTGGVGADTELSQTATGITTAGKTFTFFGFFKGNNSSDGTFARIDSGNETGVEKNISPTSSTGIKSWRIFSVKQAFTAGSTGAPKVVIRQDSSPTERPFWGMSLYEGSSILGYSSTAAIPIGTGISDRRFGLFAGGELFVSSPNDHARATIREGDNQGIFNLLELQDKLGANQIIITPAFDLNFSDTRNIEFGTTTGTKIGTAPGQKLGFWNAAPVIQPAVTGSRGGNIALTSLLTQLATTGLIVDNTVA